MSWDVIRLPFCMIRIGMERLDFYECFNNMIPTSTGGHDYVTCLETDSFGHFYFMHAQKGVMQISRDGRQLNVIASGFRNPNGMGMGPGNIITASPQEGNWTPASNIAEIKPGGYFGYGGPKVTQNRPLGYDPPAMLDSPVAGQFQWWTGLGYQ